MNRANELVERIRNYLCSGGLFNPEMMEHDKVRDLIIAARDLIDEQDVLLQEVAASGVEYESRKYYVIQIDKGTLDTIRSLQLNKGNVG